ncbi:MAG: sigma 54-interacting transcriptional regulator [Sporolactobacillus sp.]
MEKRQERIYQILVQRCSSWTKSEFIDHSGVSAQDVASQLGMLRSNVSAELNALNRRGRVIKLVTRPVLYVPTDLLQTLINEPVSETVIKCHSLQEWLSRKKVSSAKIDPFAPLIGAGGSLKNSVRQAKSAIIYPPHGLHTLIIGPTGSGKTLFAHLMHNYACAFDRMDTGAPFIEFNCADYYNNPQLLIGQLFGYVKGAFTGADHAQDGLVSKADKGILFLDEIHRLPPEGQEMLFYFMDTGRFSKLGESGNKQHAQVLIIGATTADPESALLQTFLRRIPVMINIPAFHKRSVREQVELTRALLSREAQRTKSQFHVSADVFKALIGSVTFGNIGQLKSSVQLVCAQAFLDSLSSDCVDLDAKMLPPDMLDGLARISRHSETIAQLNQLLPTALVITGERSPLLTDHDRYEPPFDLYKRIIGQYDNLSKEGLSSADIHKYITKDIARHVRDFYRQTTKDMLLTTVDPRLLRLSDDLSAVCAEALGSEQAHEFLPMLLAHLSSFLEQAPHSHATLIDQSLLKYQQDDYRVADKIATLIQLKLDVSLPEMEVLYVAFLIGSFVELSRKTCVGIVVAAHGPATASSMVSVAKELLGDYPLVAVDMPLQLNFGDIFHQIVDAVKAVDQGAGVLMMVDMGSLYYFEEKIARHARVQVKAIDMVSTPMVLDAVKNANLLHMTLKEMVHSLYHIRGTIAQIPQSPEQPHPKAILTICTTGSGIAQRIKKIVELFVNQLTDEAIEIIPISIDGLETHAADLAGKYDIVASIGAKNPKLAHIPYITLSQFVSGEGQEILQSIFTSTSAPPKNSPSHLIVKGVCEDSLQEMLTYLNPSRAVDAIVEFNLQLQKELHIHLKNAAQIRIIMHMAFALEREVTKTPLAYEEEPSAEKKQMAARLEPLLAVFQYKLNIRISDSECYYLIDMLIDEFGKSVLLTCAESQ